MDHSHRDRTYKKSRFQQELEQSVSRKLISSLLLGCLLFCIAIAVVNALNQNARREDHLAGVAATFQEVYNDTAAMATRNKRHPRSRLVTSLRETLRSSSRRKRLFL